MMEYDNFVDGRAIKTTIKYNFIFLLNNILDIISLKSLFSKFDLTSDCHHF